MTDHNHDELLEQLAEEYEPELLTLETQDGGEITLEVLSQLSYGGAEYLVGAEYTEEEQERREIALADFGKAFINKYSLK